jgi:hypothetical protein
MKKIEYASYEEYKRVQVDVNESKLHEVWADRSELALVANYVRERIPDARFGICHGARNGFEVAVLRELLGFDVIGTDISPSSREFPHMLEWDFHEPNPDWIRSLDFVYSNSWDHSYDFRRCLTVWMQSLRAGGRCFLQWTRLHSDEGVHHADCLGLSLPELESTVSALGYSVESRLLSWKRLIAGRAGGILRDYIDFLRRERTISTPRLKVVTLVIADGTA